MESVFALIDRLRTELVFDEMKNPGEDRRTEFAFGRLHGILYALEMLQEQLDAEVEMNARQQERRERDFG